MPAEHVSPTPQERLAQSRKAIVRHLRRDDGRERGAAGQPEDEDGIDQDERAPGRGPGIPGQLWPLLKHAGRSWWRHHPAHLAADIAAPALNAYAREKPLQLVGVAAGIGAAAVLIRPWRMVSFKRVAAGMLGSSELSGLVLSVLNSNNFKKEAR